jgi:hypothetical protein
MFDIVDQESLTASPGSAEMSLVVRQGRPSVNFLYMGLFLGFEKNQVAYADLIL